MGQVPLNCQYVLLPCWSTGSSGSEPRPLVQVYNFKLKTVLLVICVCVSSKRIVVWTKAGRVMASKWAVDSESGTPFFWKTLLSI